ncbi:transcription factor S [Candidatus Woesearchaeota archaeon]|jgi:transcription factor S|nr:transcription factor S [Candidatus Woesearchaeota archaeon]MBT6519226.1 transcription factor S [Candidatus Woesearchaeota archaeon]MBT7367503.1 transcription factor S [Candidatus Woesearchaeota archaeon]
MLFCPKCSALLVPKKDGNRKIMACSCGYKSEHEMTPRLSEKSAADVAEIEVVEKEIETLPETQADCSECGNDIAYFWLAQTRAGDEPETKFLRCKKCRHTWRDYS